MCPHTTICVSSYYDVCGLILLYMCPHTMYVASYYYMCPCTTIFLSAYYDVCVRILLYMCAHTTIYQSSCYYVCVLILLYTTIYVCSYYYICVLRWVLQRGSSFGLTAAGILFTTQFTYFISTKVQTLTQQSAACCRRQREMIWLLACFTSGADMLHYLLTCFAALLAADMLS
jgi:hypothetical protein